MHAPSRPLPLPQVSYKRCRKLTKMILYKLQKSPRIYQVAQALTAAEKHISVLWRYSEQAFRHRVPTDFKNGSNICRGVPMFRP